MTKIIDINRKLEERKKAATNPEFEARVQKIQESLQRINRLMNALKGLAEDEKKHTRRDDNE